MRTSQLDKTVKANEVGLVASWRFMIMRTSQLDKTVMANAEGR